MIKYFHYSAAGYMVIIPVYFNSLFTVETII